MYKWLQTKLKAYINYYFGSKSSHVYQICVFLQNNLSQFIMVLGLPETTSTSFCQSYRYGTELITKTLF